jgi:hypothetical protein
MTSKRKKYELTAAARVAPRRKSARRNSQKSNQDGGVSPPRMFKGGTEGFARQANDRSAQQRQNLNFDTSEEFIQDPELEEGARITDNHSVAINGIEHSEGACGPGIGAGRTPVVNSGLLPLPWSGRLGYVSSPV